MSPDGKRVVSGSMDGTVKVWDAQTGQLLLSLEGHTARVNSVAWSPDGKRIVSGSHDQTVKVWAADEGQEVLSPIGHTERVDSVFWSRDGKWISGRELRRAGRSAEPLTWDAATGLFLPKAPPVPAREDDAVSPDRSRRAFIEGGQLKVVRVREFAEAQKRRQSKVRAFLGRLTRPDPDYHRSKAEQYEKSGDHFAAAFHLRRLLLIEPREEVRKRLAAVQSKLDAPAKLDSERGKQPAKMPLAD
jgi:hypothetical protein